MTLLIVYKRKTPVFIKNIAKSLSVLVDSVIENNYDAKKDLNLINSVMECEECNKAIYFESTKRANKFWITDSIQTVKYCIESSVPMDQIQPKYEKKDNDGHILIFSDNFDPKIEKIFTKVFESNSKEIKRILCFIELKGKLYLRQYSNNSALDEIGPRITLNLEKILEGSFKGECIYNYKQPNRN
ncbi:hypothetical protein NUSPORA_00149 [Nucleospora cyclopteri]